MAVGAILKDKESIQLLKEIRDNVVTDEDTKGKHKDNDVFNFVGFSTSEELLGEDTESEEYQNKKAKIGKLVETGLVIEGFHIPLERKNEKKFGDQRVSDVEGKIYKYQLTNEGYAILSVAEDVDDKPSTQLKKALGSTKSPSSTNESKEVKEFKASQQKEQEQQEQQKAKEIQAFKAAQEKELEK